MEGVSKCMQNILMQDLCALGMQGGFFQLIFTNTMDVLVFARSDKFLIQLSC